MGYSPNIGLVPGSMGWAKPGRISTQEYLLDIGKYNERGDHSLQHGTSDSISEFLQGGKMWNSGELEIDSQVVGLNQPICKHKVTLALVLSDG